MCHQTCSSHSEYKQKQCAWMKQAIDLSQTNMDANVGGPFGAVIVKDGKVIATGANQVTSSNDPTAHAEMVAIRNACKVLDSFELSGCEIYTSCEPCPMCLSAIYWARLDKIYYANRREDAAAIGFDDAFLYQEIEKPLGERSLPVERVLADEAKKVFDLWQQKADKVPY